MAEKKYRRLCSGGLGARQAIFLADDHLLVVDGSYKQTYRRLFYSDIQALISRSTQTALGVRALAGLGLLVAVLGIAGGGWHWGWLFLIVPCILVMGASIWAGGSREVAVKTPIQLVRLPSVGNRRAAQKFEEQVSAEVERVQGRLTSEVLQQAIYGSKLES